MARSNPSLLGLLLWTCLVSLGGAEYVKYKDPSLSVSVRVRDLMKRMTLAEKIGQTAQIERKVASAQVMKDYFIGLCFPRGRVLAVQHITISSGMKTTLLPTHCRFLPTTYATLPPAYYAHLAASCARLYIYPDTSDGSISQAGGAARNTRDVDVAVRPLPAVKEKVNENSTSGVSTKRSNHLNKSATSSSSNSKIVKPMNVAQRLSCPVEAPRSSFSA